MDTRAQRAGLIILLTCGAAAPPSYYSTTICNGRVVLHEARITFEAEIIPQGGKVLQLYNPTRNRFFGKPGPSGNAQCVANITTTEGEYKLYFGWKVVNDSPKVTIYALEK